MHKDIAVILIRGRVDLPAKIKTTLDMLKLKRKNNCIILKDKPELAGMVKKVKDYVTWGEINENIKNMIEKKAVNGVAHLPPPRKGFERKGIKVQFAAGGALGYRGEKINELLSRMML